MKKTPDNGDIKGGLYSDTGHFGPPLPGETPTGGTVTLPTEPSPPATPTPPTTSPGSGPGTGPPHITPVGGTIMPKAAYVNYLHTSIEPGLVAAAKPTAREAMERVSGPRRGRDGTPDASPGPILGLGAEALQGITDAIHHGIDQAGHPGENVGFVGTPTGGASRGRGL